jgi:MFS family permease
MLKSRLAGLSQTLRRIGRALSHKNFRVYFTGQLISLIGTWMQSMAQGWLVYRLSGSTIDLGLVAFAGQIPVFVLSAFAGVFADRVDRRRIMIVTQAIAFIQAVLLSAITLAGLVEVWHVIALAAILGTATAIEIPARQALMVDLVAREDLPNAIALNSSLFNMGRLVGPAIGGLLVAALGEGWCFGLNAASYLAVIACLLAISLKPKAIKSGRPSAGSALIEGFGFIARTRPFPALFFNLASISLFGLSYMTLMPVMARDVLAGGPQAMGSLMAATGLGALVAALIMAARQRAAGLEFWPTRFAIPLGLFLVLFALSRDLSVSIMLQAPIGFCFLASVGGTNTLLQSHVPDKLRGRVMSVHAFCLLGLAPFGALGAGTLAHIFGAPLTIALSGAALSIISFIVARSRAISSYPPPAEPDISPSKI